DDLGYESEVYLDEEEEEDENNHSNGNVVKRGIKLDGIKLSVTTDSFEWLFSHLNMEYGKLDGIWKTRLSKLYSIRRPGS
ncbi:hypothetical protein Tco_0433627, partial [Tanacetum coccineum]